VEKNNFTAVTNKDPRHILGKSGESLAEEFLRSKGYEIVERNFKTRFGEIDLVAKDGDTLVFLEVRTKKNAVFGHPFDTVNLKKQRKIINMAKMFLVVKDIPASTVCRFDVIGLIAEEGKEIQIFHLRDAFQA